jgi:hypothetical protein
VIVIAAFLGLSLLRFGFDDDCVVDEEGEGSTGAIGFDFCASCSGKLTLEVSSDGVDDVDSC